MTGRYADVIVYLLCSLSHISDSENQWELQKQVSEYVSCLETVDPIIATNYKTSITVTVVLEVEENSMLGALLKSMGIQSTDLKCQV